ncbi:Fe-S cluster assembly protein IscX [Nocardia brasiliensis]|uniref:Fe-S cluster assembly protein IscX n=1 Tax=Nocardia brasiliensis TaxID=37326 RepID=UPI0036721F1D
MKWTDIEAIASALADKYPDVDPSSVKFVDLKNRVIGLDGFDDDRARVEDEPKILEAIHFAWIQEAE